MTNGLDLKEIKKAQLELEKERKIREFLRTWQGDHSSGVFKREINSIEIEYDLLKQSIEAEYEHVGTNNNEKSVKEAPSSIIQPEKPLLFGDTKKHKKYRKLEEIFSSADRETYINIAVYLRLVRNKLEYLSKSKSSKNKISRMRETFNKYAKIKWRQKLVATKDKTYDGLKLVSI